MLAYLQNLMIFTIGFVALGVFLGIWSNLSSDRTGTIIGEVFTISIFVSVLDSLSQLLSVLDSLSQLIYVMFIVL